MLGVLHTPEDRGMVFSPPAGVSKEGEGPIETAIRETFEETGFKLKNVNYLDTAPAGNPNFTLVVADIDKSVAQETYRHDGTAGII